MKILLLVVVFAGLGFLRGGPGDTLPPPPPPSDAGQYAATVKIGTSHGASNALTSETLTEVVQRYCVTCHNDQLLTGNLTLSSFDVDKAAEEAETAERMIRKLRVGMMPPPGMPRPAGDTLQKLVETLETQVDAAAKAAPNLGERQFQRLSRAEYERVIGELLSLEVDASKWLPADFYNHGFDNQWAAQQFSATLLDGFLRAAGEVSRLAVGNPDADL